MQSTLLQPRSSSRTILNPPLASPPAPAPCERAAAAAAAAGEDRTQRWLPMLRHLPGLNLRVCALAHARVDD